MEEDAISPLRSGAAIGRQASSERAATIMLVVLSVIWGVSWPLMKIALTEIPPFSMRVSTAGLGALTLLAFTTLRRRSIRLPNRKAWLHAVVAGLLNIVGFSLLNSFAQLSATTSRVTVLVYTMPVWAALLALPILGERLTRVRSVALVLCVVGLAVVVAPLIADGIPEGAVLAIGSGFSWAAGTVYLKWAQIEGDPLAVTTWQLVLAFLVIAACLPFFEGAPHVWPVHWDALFGLVYTGVLAVGIAYALWFDIVWRLPATTAALGILSVPPIGVATRATLDGGACGRAYADYYTFTHPCRPVPPPRSSASSARFRAPRRR
jgi:drug/metabolite transporter (DMT)-like permease